MQLKEVNAQAKLAKKEGARSDWEAYKSEAAGIEQRLARQKAFEDESRQLKATWAPMRRSSRSWWKPRGARSTARKRGASSLVACTDFWSRRKSGYLPADRRECVAMLENLHAKYAVTTIAIDAVRDEAATKLSRFLVELGYE